MSPADLVIAANLLALLLAAALGVRALFASALKAAETSTPPADTPGKRLALYEDLLAQPDPPDITRRGFVRTVAGKPDRHESTWLPASRAWLARRMDRSVGRIEGWKPRRRGRNPRLISNAWGLKN